MIEKSYLSDPDYVFLSNKIKNYRSIHRRVINLNAKFKFEEKRLLIIIDGIKYCYHGFEFARINNSLKIFCFDYKIKNNSEIVLLIKRLIYNKNLFVFNYVYSQKELFNLISEVKDLRDEWKDIILSETI